MPRPESELRDFLADHLHLLGSVLTLMDPEFYLPNTYGASGFIDLLARDQHGMIVIIEIKRSENSARQTIQELHKYTALLRQQHGLGAADVRCLVVSTHWHELLVPFSQLVRLADYEVAGLLLELDDDGWPSGTTTVEPLEEEQAVDACPKHHVFLYTSAVAAEEQMPNVVAGLSTLGVADFFVLQGKHVGLDPAVIYPHCLYVVLAAFDPVRRAAIEAKGSDYVEEWYANEFDHEEVVFADLNQFVQRHDLEVGYPDKFRHTSKTWDYEVVARGGRYSSEVVWTSDGLENVAAGGKTGYSVSLSEAARPGQRARWTRLRQNVDTCLLGAEEWRELMGMVMTEVEASGDGSELEISIYCLSDTLWTLNGLANGNVGYVPALNVKITTPNAEVSRIVGSLCWDGSTFPTSFGELIGSVFENGIDDYMAAFHFGQQWRTDAAIRRAHGLFYALFEAPEEGAATHRLTPAEGAIERVTWNQEYPLFLDFANQNYDYMMELRDAFDARFFAPGL